MKKRIEWIDICKGLAIILVIIGHSKLETGIAFNLKSIIYSFHMPLFFILSGYLFYNVKDKKRKMLEFTTKKIKSLVIPYITFNIILLIFDLLKSLVTNNQINLLYRLIGIIFPIRNNINVGKAWFLIWIFFTELIYQFVSINIKNKRIITVLCVISFYTGFFLIKKNIALPYHLDAAFVSVLFYHIGHMLKEKNIEINSRYTILLLILIFFVTTLTNIFIINRIYDKKTTIDLYEMTLSFPIIYFVNSICGSLLVIIISKRLNLEFIKKLLKKIGYNSLCMYGFHTIIIQICVKIINHIYILQGSATYELIRCCIIIIMCLLLLPVCKICEKYFPLLFGYKRGGQR